MIDIIIPVYNKEHCVKRCLNSVLTQTFQDWHCFIVNDGSPDNSEAEILPFLTDRRFEYIKKKNGGVSSARNTGLRESRSEWVMFLDADDYLLPHCLGSLISSAQIYDTSFVAGNFYLENKGQRIVFLKEASNGIVKNPIKDHYLNKICPRCGAYIYKRNVMSTLFFDENLSRYEDVAVLFSLLNNCTVSAVPEPVMVYTEDFNYLSKQMSNIERDFVYYIDVTGKCFWERLFLYRFMKEAWMTYPSKRKELWSKYKKYMPQVLLYNVYGKLLKIIYKKC